MPSNAAQKIITMQQAEIGELDNILSSLTVDNTDMDFTMEQMDNIRKVGKPIYSLSSAIDNDFATLMIIHHQGALDNASAYLHHGNNTR
jgi:hypothetical protein